VTLGSRLSLVPSPKGSPSRFSPWGRLASYRRTYDGLIDSLIAQARQDPNFDDRTDVLSLFLRSTYDDGTAMSRSDIGDELLALLAAGHETTASTLGWAFERISRHPVVLERLVAEAAGDDNSYRLATIYEVQRNRTVIDFAGRHVSVPMYELGDWRIPEGFSILISLLQLHSDPDVYPDPQRFNPQRFIDAKPNPYSWVPFGGGTRRCVGAAFAHMEMDIVLRTVLRHFTIQTTDAAGEKWHHRGVAFTPKKGGRVVMYRRATPLG
jgi:cytochrome P450